MNRQSCKSQTEGHSSGEEHLRLQFNQEVYKKISEEVSGGYPFIKYQKLEKIGRGGTSTVYKGIELKTGRQVAIKILNIFPKQAVLVKPRLYNELRHMKQCKHPNIVEYLDSYIVDNQLWIVMEYVEGLSLAGIVAKRRLSAGEISIISSCILSALQYLHSNRLIHRDVKSDNILVGSNGTVKLADLGFCVPEGTQLERMIGTYCCMAPELIQNTNYDCKVDVWSFGKTLIEMLTGKPPYCYEHSSTIMAFIIKNGQPKIPDEEKLGPKLRDFLNCCLQIDINLRTSAADLLRHAFLQTRECYTPASHQVTANMICQVKRRQHIWCNSTKTRWSKLNVKKREQRKRLVELLRHQCYAICCIVSGQERAMTDGMVLIGPVFL